MTNIQRVLSPKLLPFKLKQNGVSASASRYTREEVLDEVFADAYSDFDSESGSNESEEESYVGESLSDNGGTVHRDNVVFSNSC